MSERVLVAEGHVPTRLGLRAALAAGGMQVVADTATCDETVERAIELRPELCVIDAQLPGGGIAAAERICTAVPRTRVVMLSTAHAPADVLEALRAGAIGFLPKSVEPGSLLRALHAVLAGQAAIPRDLVGPLVTELRELSGDDRAQFARRHGAELTAREWKVVELLRAGASTAEMAERLRISPVTVRRHVGRALRKLGAADRAAARRMLDDLVA